MRTLVMDTEECEALDEALDREFGTGYPSGYAAIDRVRRKIKDLRIG